jgi:hypothetical protein
MIESHRFDTINSPTESKSSIELKLGEKTKVPFTGAEIIHATTITGDRVVIKKPLRNEQARHEWEGLKIAESTGISVPEPVALVNYTENQLAIVSGYIDGEKLYETPNPDIKFEVGKQIKMMHQRAHINGNSWTSSSRSTFIYYDRYIFNWTNGDIEELNKNSRSVAILEELTDSAEQFCVNSKPVFNHNDLHDGQVIESRKR